MDSKDKECLVDCFSIFWHTMKHINKLSQALPSAVKLEVKLCMADINGNLKCIDRYFNDHYKEQKMIAKVKKKHPGFKKASADIQKKEGVSKKSADAILASGARKASAKAKKANPKLKKVKGK